MSTPLDVRALLDPEVAAALTAIPFDLGILSDATLPAIRAGFAAAPPLPLSDQVERSDHAIPGRAGVSVRVHRPKGASGALPCVYWIHGGGLILGNNKQDDLRFDRWCQSLSCVGVSVDYRLAPESRYPEPL